LRRSLAILVIVGLLSTFGAACTTPPRATTPAARGVIAGVAVMLLYPWLVQMELYCRVHGCF
jgi:hypothetical protein